MASATAADATAADATVADDLGGARATVAPEPARKKVNPLVCPHRRIVPDD